MQDETRIVLSFWIWRVFILEILWYINDIAANVSENLTLFVEDI